MASVFTPESYYVKMNNGHLCFDVGRKKSILHILQTLAVSANSSSAGWFDARHLGRCVCCERDQQRGMLQPHKHSCDCEYSASENTYTADRWVLQTWAPWSVPHHILITSAITAPETHASPTAFRDFKRYGWTWRRRTEIWEGKNTKSSCLQTQSRLSNFLITFFLTITSLKTKLILAVQQLNVYTQKVHDGAINQCPFLFLNEFQAFWWMSLF